MLLNDRPLVPDVAAFTARLFAVDDPNACHIAVGLVAAAMMIAQNADAFDRRVVADALRRGAVALEGDQQRLN